MRNIGNNTGSRPPECGYNSPRARRSRPLRVTHPFGLTLRAACEIVHALRTLDAEITLEHSGAVANGRSILSLLCLAAPCRATVSAAAVGRDAAQALDVLAKLFASGFGIRHQSFV